MTLLTRPVPVSESEPEPESERSDPAGRGRRQWTATASRVAFGLVVLAGVAARFSGRGALWLDEAISVDIARQPLGDIAAALRQDGHPPLYYVLLHLWMTVFGTSGVAVRSLSGLISVATLPLGWAAGRRIGGTRTAAITTVLLASSPFAVRYATETRMYSLCTLLALAGLLAIRRAVDDPRPLRLGVVALVVTATLYTHYWGLWLVAAAAITVGVLGLLRRPCRPFVAVLVAMALGAVPFLAWVPSLLYQAHHTGTPWGRSIEPFDALFDTIIDLGGGKWAGGRILGPLLALLMVLALVAIPLDRWRLSVDLRTVPGVRVELAAAGTCMVIGLGVAIVTSSAFQPRYASAVVPLVLVAVALGIARLPARGVRAVVMAVVVLLGLAGSVRWSTATRTQGGAIGAVLASKAEPGDVVAYCPDQLRPSVQRVLDQRGVHGLASVTLPSGSPPGRVDWVDYRERIRRTDPAATARRLLAEAGSDHAVWLVTNDTYRGFGSSCRNLRAALGQIRPSAQTLVRFDHDAYERAVLFRFDPP